MAAFSPPSPDTLIEDQPAGFTPPDPDSLILPTNKFGETTEDLKAAMAKVRRERMLGDAGEGLASGAEAGTKVLSRLFPTTALGDAAEAAGLRPLVPKEHVLQLLDASQKLLPNAGTPDNLAPQSAEDRAIAEGVRESAAEQASGMTRLDALALLGAGVKAPLPVARTFQISPFVSFPGAVQNLEEASKRGDVSGTSKAIADLTAQATLPALIEHGIPAEAPLRIPDVRYASGADLNTPEGAIPPRPRKVYEQPDAPVEPANVQFGKPEVPATAPEPQRDVTVLQEIRAAGARTKEQIRELYPHLTREEAAAFRKLAWDEKPGAVPTTERTDALQRETEEAIPPLRQRPVESVPEVPAESPGPEAGQRGGAAEEEGQIAPEVKPEEREIVPPAKKVPKTAQDFIDMKPEHFSPWMKLNRYGPENTTDTGATKASHVAKDFTPEDVAKLTAERDRLDPLVDKAGEETTKKYGEALQLLKDATDEKNPDMGAKIALKKKADDAMAAANKLQKVASELSLKRQTLNEFIIYGPKAEAATPAAEPAAPKAPEVNFGIWPESEWSASNLAKQTPAERISKAKFLGLRDKQGQLILGPKTLADAAAKRIAEIKAEAAKPKPAPEPVSIPEPSNETPKLDKQPKTQNDWEKVYRQEHADLTDVQKRLEHAREFDPDAVKALEQEKSDILQRLEQFDSLSGTPSEVTYESSKEAALAAVLRDNPRMTLGDAAFEVARLRKQNIADRIHDEEAVPAEALAEYPDLKKAQQVLPKAGQPLVDVPRGVKPLQMRRQQIVGILEKLTDIDEKTGEMVPKEGLSEKDEARIIPLKAELFEVEARLMRGEKAVPKAPAAKPAGPEAKPAAQPAKPAEPATKAPEAATKAAKSPSSGNEPADIQAKLEDMQALIEKRSKIVEQWHAKLQEDAETSQAIRERNQAGAKLEIQAGELEKQISRLQNDLFDYNWKQETAKFRGQPSEKPSPPAITNKVLKAQRENLLEQVDEALKDAPEEGAEKIKIAVPGDGEFTISNTKEALKRFRDHAAKEFPDTVGSVPQPKVKSGKPSTIPKVEEPKPADLPKIVGQFVSTDKDRFRITGSYADGTQVVATDGRQLIRVWTDKAPGSTVKPVRFNAEGKPVEIEGSYPDFLQIRDKNPKLLKGGVKTDEIYKLAAQAKLFSRDEKSFKPVALFINKDGSIGARQILTEGDVFEHNVQPGALKLGAYNPEFLLNAMDAARRLGNEKVDIYSHSDEGGPLGFVGKNHESIVMPVRLADEVKFRDAASDFAEIAGKKTHPSPVTGLGPVQDPDAYISRGTPNSGFIVVGENGKLRLRKENKEGSYAIGKDFPIDEFGKTAKEQRKAIEQMLEGIPHTKEATSEIRVAANDVLDERTAALKEIDRRREAEIQRNALKLHIIPPVPEWAAKIAKAAGKRLYQARKAFPSIVSSRPVRHTMDQLRDAADTEADVFARQMANRIKTGHTEIEDEAASAMIAGKFDPAEFPGLIAKAIRGNNLKARRALEYALGHWSEVEPMAREGERVFENQLAEENSNGINTEYHEGYLPGVYDEDLWMGRGRPFVIGGRGGSGISTGFKKGKTYATPYDAISDGYVPKTLRLSDLVENRVKRGQRLINRKEWGDALRSLQDPTDHVPIVTDLIHHTRGPGQPGFEAPPVGYVSREVIPGNRVAVRENYAKLFDALTGTSFIHEFEPFGVPAGTLALEGAGAIKHGLLAVDTYHAVRIMLKQLIMTGKVGFNRGHTLLEYTDRDLNAAVAAHEIKPEWAAWARANRPTANLLIKQGFNVGRIQENMYQSLIRDVPIIGPFNKWVFEKMTRGAMLQSGLIEFEKVRNANPGWSDQQVAAKVARDLNVYFGNLGRQGVFKSQGFRDSAMLAFLAPNWVEAMARSEIGGMKQLTIDPLTTRTLKIGSLGRAMAGGLGAYFVATQLLNLYTRGHPTWQNPEEGHKMDAWVPDIGGKSNGFFISPMGMVAELSHDLMKYTKTEGNVLAGAWRIMKNRMSPYGRATRVLLEGRDWDDSKIPGFWPRIAKAGVALAPTPIPLQTVGKTVKPGQVQRQTMSSLGIKMDPAESPRVQIMNQGRDWALNNPDPKIKAAAEREQTGDREDSIYKPLRLAISKSDRQGIIDEVKAIVQLEPKEKQADRLKQVLKNMDPFSPNGIKPFATPIRSKAAELAFVKSMNADQKAAYKQAVKDAVKDYRKLTEAIYGKPRNPPDVPEAYRELLK